jgi:hypothetical protein
MIEEATHHLPNLTVMNIVVNHETFNCSFMFVYLIKLSDTTTVTR